MKDIGKQAARSVEIAGKVAQLQSKRLQLAGERYAARVEKAWRELAPQPSTTLPDPAQAWGDWQRYVTDAAQRSILFWDTLRQRGNRFLEHERAGKPPVLHFDHEMALDGRTLERPVNYALVRIVPPPGVKVDPERRPYVIIDPRAGHGPGIGGMKDDSQVGVALRDGHPVYFVIFFAEPEPGQTLLDVCEAERQFIAHVRRLHPKSAKPVVIGNCQGGWAAMMVAAANPDDVGPIVINGAPMSYWGGAWSEGEGDNPMRYAGGNLGGTWLASLTADIGDGVFDGAWLVDNFEGLNPANTWWGKYYNLYSKVDSEAPRFLDFERWWGGFYLMNREEIEWITRNLFVGNKLWTGGTKARSGKAFDLRDIRAPIVLFASLGDNITPPQQAFNWVADVYGSTEEIKANGQVIVGLIHQDIGHLGIFVSGKVAKKEHAQIVSVLKSIEALPPGLYGMAIEERKGKDGAVEYAVEFREVELEEVASRLNRFERIDEKPFQAVAAISEFNQRAYELFMQPLVQASANEFSAKLQRQLHPLRVQRWALSDLNPWLAWLEPAAAMVRSQRKPAEPDNPLLKVERASAAALSASLECYRAMRDAASEATFFQIYGNVFSLYVADKHAADGNAAERIAEPRELPFVAEALASMDKGGYPEALARVACLLARKGEPLLLSRLQQKSELIKEYRDLLPDMPWDQWRRVRGEQELIVRFEPEKALATLPRLLADPADRAKLATLARALMGDARFRRAEASAEQREMIETIGHALEEVPVPARRTAAKRRAAPAKARKRAVAARS
jgi:pimeloyl-ACP methyl ester carboxylesterase